MFVIRLLISIAVLAVALCERVSLEQGHEMQTPKFWTKLSRESILPSTEIQAIFVLKHCPKKVKELEAKLYDLSTPTSPNYGKWLSKDEIVNNYLAVHQDHIDAVQKFLVEHGVKNIRISDLKDKIFVKMPAALAEKVLDTEFAMFRSTDHKRITIPRIIKGYSLPAEIARYVALVDDIVRFPNVAGPLKGSAPASSDNGSGDASLFTCGSGCTNMVSPTVLSQTYNIPYPLAASVASGSSVAVAEFQDIYWDQSDLSSFDGICNSAAAVTNTIGGNDAGECSSGQCLEAMLDIEYLGALTNPVPLTVIYTEAYSLQSWIDTVLSMNNPPWVHSVSYGNDERQQSSVAYMETCNTGFMAAGAMGMSLLFASGDQGVWGREGPTPRYGFSFNPDFPASSPYITSVGGTNFKQATTIGEEVVWNCGGGGFSNVFAQPSFQAAAVNAYLSNPAANLPDASKFNATGRAYPDVAALGGGTNPYCVFDAGSAGGVWGTSASCPVTASVFTQLNNIRFAAGKPSLGWLNPFIYANTDCFNDVTEGKNNCQPGLEGFSAAANWDPASGNGTPNYTCLVGRIQ